MLIFPKWVSKFLIQSIRTVGPRQEFLSKYLRSQKMPEEVLRKGC